MDETTHTNPTNIRIALRISALPDQFLPVTCFLRYKVELIQKYHFLSIWCTDLLKIFLWATIVKSLAHQSTERSERRVYWSIRYLSYKVGGHLTPQPHHSVNNGITLAMASQICCISTSYQALYSASQSPPIESLLSLSDVRHSGYGNIKYTSG